MERKFMKGNEAIAEAAIRAGCRFFAGYPITPQNEIPEYLSRRLPEEGGIFIQGESEIAAINMVCGASAAGFRGNDIFLQSRNIFKTRRDINNGRCPFASGNC